MLDFLKLSSTYIDHQKLLENPLLDFVGNYSCDSGEEVGKKVAKYQNLEFTLYRNNYTEIKGSLHIFKNAGFHNFDDFSFSQIQQQLNRFEGLFGLDARALKIENIEIGLNIRPPIPSNTLLSSLLFHNGNRFKDVSVKNGDYRQVMKQRYAIKAYDKSIQHERLHSVPKNLFRFERKQLKMIDLQKASIYTMADLNSPHWLNTFGEILLDDWDKVLLFDTTIRTEELSKHQNRIKLTEWSSVRWWESLKPYERSRQLKKYRSIVRDHSGNLHSAISDLLMKKWNTLSENANELTSYNSANC